MEITETAPFALTNARFNSAMQQVLNQHVDSSASHSTPIDRMCMTLVRHMGLRCEVSAHYLRYHTPIENMTESLLAWLGAQGWELVASDTSLSESPLADSEDVDEDEEPGFFDDFGQNGVSSLYFHPQQEMLLRVSCGKRHITPTLHADQEAVAKAFLLALTQEFPPNSMPPADDDHIDVYFWNNTEYGPQANVQQLTCPTWEEIQHNYAPEIRERLDALMNYEPEKAGIILWSGEPGTGKTTALRGLMQAWRNAASFHLIIDPEIMLNNPGYMQHLLVNADSSEGVLFLILEDAGELVAKGARDVVGQGLSRLLNMTDGLLGQGRKLIILITTNEEQEALNDAITRPGRGIQSLDFRPLNEEEIATWCDHMGVDAPESCDGTVAALYEHTRVKKSRL